MDEHDKYNREAHWIKVMFIILVITFIVLIFIYA
jgi:hypothetical protein